MAGIILLFSATDDISSSLYAQNLVFLYLGKVKKFKMKISLVKTQ